MKQILALALVVLVAVPGEGFAQATAPPAVSDIAVLQLKVIDGEAAVHAAGSRSTGPLTVQVSDETGRPVEGVTVSFRLPTDGATGLFESGLLTEVLVTGRDGKASIFGIRWGKTAGPVRLRITAVRGEVRGGIFSSQYVAEPEVTAKKGSEPTRPAASKGRNRWVVFAVVAAGAAAGGLVVGVSGKTAGTAGGPAGSQTSTSLSVGAPSIQVGRP